MQSSAFLEGANAYRAKVYEENPLFWLRKQVHTFDEHDKRKDPKPFPAHKPYLEKSVAIFQSFPWLIEKKSRQLVKSWMYCALHLHIVQFWPMSRVLFFSKDEDDAIKLRDRAWFIYENQDLWVRKMFPARKVGNNIEFSHPTPEGVERKSVIEAMPEGEDEPRGQVATAIFFDEFSFNRFARKNLGNALPMAEGGGRITICFTAEPSFAEQKHAETCSSATERRVLFRGVDVHGDEIDAMVLHLPKSKDEFAALWTGYAADPEIAEKIKKVRAKYESLGELPYFAKEYDGDANALSGEPVLPQLSKARHGIDIADLPPEFERWAKYAAVDHGYRNWTAVNWFAVSPPGWRGCRATLPDGRTKDISVIVFYRELHVRGRDAEDIDKLWALISSRNAGDHIETWIIDPSTDRHHGTEKRGKSVFEQIREAGMRPIIKADNDVDGGYAQVRRSLATYGETPALLICNHLEHTWRESIGLRFKEMSEHYLADNDPREEIRAKDNHHPDAVRYGVQHRPVPRLVESSPVPPRGTFKRLMQDHAALQRRGTRNADPRSFRGVMRRVH